MCFNSEEYNLEVVVYRGGSVSGESKSTYFEGGLIETKSLVCFSRRRFVRGMHVGKPYRSENGFPCKVSIIRPILTAIKFINQFIK